METLVKNFKENKKSVFLAPEIFRVDNAHYRLNVRLNIILDKINMYLTTISPRKSWAQFKLEQTVRFTG